MFAGIEPHTIAADAASNGSGNGNRIWSATSTGDGTFATPLVVTNVNAPADDRPGWVSTDGRRLYLMSTREPGVGGFDLYVAERASR